MFYPTIFNDSIFDDLMDFAFPAVREANEVDKKLYGKHAAHVMRTDVREHDDGYEVDIDLPGFKKEEISLSLDNGYLTVSASKGLDKKEENEKGKLIRQERYSGSMQRSYYVGKEITEEDIKASFHHGVLSLQIPKKDAAKLPEKKQILIEG
jgi:HSP20 family molecular chaperone IbpA